MGELTSIPTLRAAQVASELERLSDPTSAVGSPYFATLEEVVTGAGLEPWMIESVVGRVAARDLVPDQPINEADLASSAALKA